MWKRIGGGGRKIVKLFLFFFQLKNVYWPPFLSFFQYLGSSGEEKRGFFPSTLPDVTLLTPPPPFAAVMTHGTDGKRIHQKIQRNFHLEAMFLQAGTNTKHTILY